MATPEEQIASMQKQIEEFQAKGMQTDSLQKTVDSLTNQIKDRDERDKKRDMDFAMKEALLEFPEAKGMESMLTGATPDEIKTKAKTFAETIRKRDAEWQAKVAAAAVTDRRNAWDQVPGSVPSHLAIGKDRQDQYAAVRGAQTGKMQKIVTLMGMHIEDLFKRHIVHERAKLGV